MKRTFKKHSDNAVNSILDQLATMIKGKHSPKNMGIIEACRLLLDKSDKKTKYWFVTGFNRIIKTTSIYFINGIPLWIKNYYKDMFEKKIHQIFVNTIFKNIDDEMILSYSKNLYKAFMKETVLKNWSEFAKKHFYMNKDYPYNVK